MISIENPARLVKRTSIVSTGIASAVLFVAPAIQGAWQLAAIALLLGVVSTITSIKNRGTAFRGLEFAGFMLLAGAETTIQTSPLLGLLGVTTALAAWDLGFLGARLTAVDTIHDPENLVRTHLERLVIVLTLGFALGGTALFVRLDYGIGTAIGLALILVISLSQVISHIRRRSD